jgi:two-component system, OmpR family, alkaline phosphatase synthesis response regulator PhoP
VNINKQKILIVEDEESLAKALVLNFELEGYQVTNITSGTEAHTYFKSNNAYIQLVLLDVMLPGINGFDLCAEFKKLNSNVPVIFLTAKNLSNDKISGLKLGADDYIVKPFELEELLLRVNNVIKRNSPKSKPEFIFSNGQINFETFEIIDCQQQKHLLSKREIGLLKLLTDKENHVVSRDEIIEKLWDINENASSRTIDNYILAFRKHFEINPKEPKHFHSIRGVGYKFSA